MEFELFIFMHLTLENVLIQFALKLSMEYALENLGYGICTNYQISILVQSAFIFIISYNLHYTILSMEIALSDFVKYALEDYLCLICTKETL